MNPIIKKQLNKCVVAAIPEFDDSTTSITIMKGAVLSISPSQLHQCFLVQLADSILNPSENSYLADNWNNGQIPKYKYYNAEICELKGKMVRISGVAYDTISNRVIPEMWEGWVPQSSIKIMKELE